MPSADSTLVQLSPIREGERIMRLCNACRYCEGYCAVFPAMERRLAFTEQDLHYLANLCHNCGECYYACPYTPPHEFALNLPRTFAEIRATTYRKYAWPGLFAGLFRRNGLTVSLATALGAALFLIALLVMNGPTKMFSAHSVVEGAFYSVLPQGAMTVVFMAVSAFVLAALVVPIIRFWCDQGGTIALLLDPAAIAQASWDALRLRYLEGGGDGCAYPDDVSSHSRRWFHHLTFYGFALCFASTTVAAIYHYVFKIGRAHV